MQLSPRLNRLDSARARRALRQCRGSRVPAGPLLRAGRSSESDSAVTGRLPSKQGLEKSNLAALTRIVPHRFFPS